MGYLNLIDYKMLSRFGTMGGASPFASRRGGGMMQGMMSMMDSPACVRKGTSLDQTAGDTPLRPGKIYVLLIPFFFKA